MLQQNPQSGSEGPELSERQRAVLRAVVASYVAESAPVGSKTLSQLLPVRLSPASIRNTMAELTELGLISKAHASSGRVPTEEGLRYFAERVLVRGEELGSYHQRELEHCLRDVDAAEVVQRASEVLSERTQQMGFALAPSLERVQLQHVSLVRLSKERLLVVLVSQSGQAYRRVLDDSTSGEQRELDRIAAELNTWVAGCTLRELRAVLEVEQASLRGEANRLLGKALALGLRATEPGEEAPPDLVFSSQLALLHQPEFSDPALVRELLDALRANERLIEVLGRVLEGEGVSVALGPDFEESALRQCALVQLPTAASAFRWGLWV